MQFNFRDQMDKWGWIVAVIVLSVFTLRMLWGRDAFCGDDSDQCIREWVSALGGWIALPGLVFLALQIRNADMNHRELVQLQTTPKYLLADHIDNVAAIQLISTKKRLEFWRNFQGDAEEFRTIAYAHLQNTRDALVRDDITKFNQEIGFTTMSPSSLCLIADLQISIVESNPPLNNPEVIKGIIGFFEIAAMFFQEIKTASESYIKRTEGNGMA